jgi:enoyl-CoA hydratase/carnithine racemase
MSDLVHLERSSEAIAMITLNRPSVGNALSGKLLFDFLALLEELESSNTIRILILRGSGKHFCAGLDLKEAAKNSGPYDAKTMASMVARVLVHLRTSRLITIAAAQGSAIGGGGGIVAACDLALGNEAFRIGFPEVRRGLEPALLLPLLKRRLNGSHVRELLLTGLPFDAPKAKEAGLIQEIVSEKELLGSAQRLATEIAHGEAQAVKGAKKRILQHDDESFAEEMSTAVEEHARSWDSEQASEGIRAFREKRPPRWHWEKS